MSPCVLAVCLCVGEHGGCSDYCCDCCCVDVLSACWECFRGGRTPGLGHPPPER